jgi:hypothetical protein
MRRPVWIYPIFFFHLPFLGSFLDWNVIVFLGTCVNIFVMAIALNILWYMELLLNSLVRFHSNP